MTIGSRPEHSAALGTLTAAQQNPLTETVKKGNRSPGQNVSA
jgi:hypothetical protein